MAGILPSTSVKPMTDSSSVVSIAFTPSARMAGPAMLLVGGALALALTRRKPKIEDDLSDEEKARIAELMKD